MHSASLKLTDAQLRKLAKGQGVIIKPTCYDEEEGYGIYMSPMQHKRLMRAHSRKRGYTMKLSPEEMMANEVEMEGGRINWKKIGRQLRSTAKAVGRFYRKEIRPEVGPALRKLVKKGIEKGIPAATTALSTLIGQPELGAMAEPYAERFAKKVSEPITEKISKTTGAYGIKTVAKKKKSAPKKKAPPKQLTTSAPLAEQINAMEFPPILPYKAQIQNNYSGFLNPNHPAMHPTLPLPDMSLPIVRKGGMKGRGLFMRGEGMGEELCGHGLYMRGGALLDGLPNDPILPQRDMSYALWGNSNPVRPICS